jgi:hypothetical protein
MSYTLRIMRQDITSSTVADGGIHTDLYAKKRLLICTLPYIALLFSRMVAPF